MKTFAEIINQWRIASKKKKLKSCPLLSSAGTAGFMASVKAFFLSTCYRVHHMWPGMCLTPVGSGYFESVRALSSFCATFLFTLPCWWLYASANSVCTRMCVSVCAFNEGGLHLWITLLHYCIRLYAVAERWGAYICTPATYLQLLWACAS